ncbi:MAG TPA: LacI family DNA-binding transcriptional regulator [Trebonia sp.]|nr:LacI family DNA-binding transcriptional regulator [Trebonia sp.]
MKVRLAEVAAAAGVSVPTVSKVVHGRSDVAADTRSRVEAALAAYKYTAPRRAPEGPGLIDLVFTGPLNPWAVEIINGAEKATAAAGHRLTISILDGKAASDEWLARVSASRTNGIILGLAELPPAYRARLTALNVPMVIVDPVGQPDPHIPSVGAANWAGAYTATEFLIKLGHRRIGTITGRPSLPCSQARVNGYLAALEHAGLTADPALVRTGDFAFEAALTAATAMLERSDRPSAIFAGNDFEAMGVYEAARRQRLRIPEDLSVVGFDDLPMSAWVAPPLTTVAQPLAEMAAAAAQIVLQSAPDAAGNRVELATSLVVRSSTAPPGRGRR